MNEFFAQIKKLELKNPPSIIINKCGEFKDLSYEEMEKKEEELINNIPNINNYPLVNKGIKSLVKHLTKIQQESLMNVFKNISYKINEEINNNQKILDELPKECETPEDFMKLFKKCILKFSKNIKSEMERLSCNSQGEPINNLMKYDIQLEYINHIRTIKEKINVLFTESFCIEITNYRTQYNLNRFFCK